MHANLLVCTFVLFVSPIPFALAAASDDAPRWERTPAPVFATNRATNTVTNPSPTPAPAPASASTLEQMRGGSETVATPASNTIASDTQLRGTTDNNVATNVVTGNNAIQSSFSNAAGIPVVIQNSGANVLIQNATVVNLQFK